MDLFTRVKIDVPSTLIKDTNGNWIEFVDTWPMTYNPANKFFFGAHGFSDQGSNQSAFQTPQRLYIGGHQYIIDNTLKNELTAAVTSQAPAGYGAFVAAAPPGMLFTGDEILLSGYMSDMGGTGYQSFPQT